MYREMGRHNRIRCLTKSVLEMNLKINIQHVIQNSLNYVRSISHMVFKEYKHKVSFIMFLLAVTFMTVCI
jgi:hypothetical protein